jgi:hypothetical protein
MSSSDDESSKETRKRDWLDWAQGGVALLAASVAILINIQQHQLNSQLQTINVQQRQLKSQQDNIDLTLKKESTTTLFTDRILEQLNAVTEENSGNFKGAILLELMGLDIQAHLVSRTGDKEKLIKLEEDCDQIPSRIALFIANVDALDVSDEANWVRYAYDTDNRIARHTALVALGSKALQSRNLSSADSSSSNLVTDGPKLAKLLTNRLVEIFKLSDNLESPDLAIDALDAISRLAVRHQHISGQLKGSEILVRVLQGMRDLESRLHHQKGSPAFDQLKQKSTDDLEGQLHDQLTALESTGKTLAATGFCDDGDWHAAVKITATN